MTNTENVPANYVVTSQTEDGHWDHPAMAFRYLSWLERVSKGAETPADLSGFSVERQEGMADLVRNGLVEERKYTGELDGLTTLKITELGMHRLNQAWEAAALLVVG
ncbi:MAG: hypothetical protein WC054_00070 [Candidatus Nanopelagicales bacterium]